MLLEVVALITETQSSWTHFMLSINSKLFSTLRDKCRTAIANKLLKPYAEKLLSKLQTYDIYMNINLF